MENFLEIALPVIRSIALAIIALFFGLMIIRWIGERAGKYLEKTGMDETLKPFIISLVTTVLKILLAISIIRVLGIDTTSFVAVIAAVGFAIGLAFQGSLANFAGGVLLLTLRSFKVGDFVEAGGFMGTVQSIQILHTELTTPDNKLIYIPNGNLSNSSIINFSAKDKRRADFKFGVGYEEDTDRVISVLKDVVESHKKILKEPAPFVRMSEHADSAVIFTVRVWAMAEDFWNVYFDVIEMVKKRFDQEKISANGCSPGQGLKRLIRKEEKKIKELKSERALAGLFNLVF